MTMAGSLHGAPSFIPSMSHDQMFRFADLIRLILGLGVGEVRRHSHLVLCTPVRRSAPSCFYSSSVGRH